MQKSVDEKLSNGNFDHPIESYIKNEHLRVAEIEEHAIDPAQFSQSPWNRWKSRHIPAPHAFVKLTTEKPDPLVCGFCTRHWYKSQQTQKKC